ncbi:hypothetical protein EDD18DRAFT_1409012 [Armillaria luteobubalina]|uniref:Mid2 domain-containing protein n=1 Tax=Armillaria luteobubalina TaxID=153913 RepID=A0AA39Q0N1_9AGAR|nr:hypothetical protein EDD18DRAFT_1409012 [Armillaria luteobubalina]
MDSNFVIATSQIFDVASAGVESITVGEYSGSTPSVSVNLSGLEESMGSSTGSAPITVTISADHSSTASVQSTSTAPSSSNLIHQNHNTGIIVGAVIGSLAFLLIIFGGITFLFIRRRRRQHNRITKHRLSPNPLIIHDMNSHSPPATNIKGEAIAAMLAGAVAPGLGDRSQETVEQNPGRTLIEAGGERRNSVSLPVHIDTPEPQRGPQQDGSHAAGGDVVAEAVRLRIQFQQFIEVVEREAGRVNGNALDPPPAYA